ncbi:MAG: 16S rRNA (uracil(1498)-N(3))-methyltransferase [Candidatus Dormibacteraeota bacterium]|nr:16S rRNA (uracil(1498)-N(3))-methyltransferase [Candidatus Dormibacteraeota bacterium]
MPTFFVEREGARAVIVGDDARHLARSLRARVGEEIEVVDPTGKMLTLRLDRVSPERVEGVVVAERDHNPEPVARIVIAIAHLPAPALELVLSRCTEAGAFGFHIVQADRSVARGSKPERWRTICREAAMLAGRLAIPEVAGPSSLETVVEMSEYPVMLARAATLRLSEMAEPQNLTLLIGPEGGWSEREMAIVSLKATLGPRNLRADTAALVALTTALSARA